MKILRSLNKTLKLLEPPPKLTISEYAEKYMVLTSESSAEPGRWRPDRAPYQKGIMDAVSDRDIRKVVIMSSAQVGKTLILLMIIAYYIDYKACPMMMVMPVDKLLKAFSKDRLTPMIKANKRIRNKVLDEKARDSGNTTLYKSFPGGSLTLAGANSTSDLSSRSIKVLVLDEVDRFPASVGGEGDPVRLAEKRTTAYTKTMKLVYVSTPTLAGISRIEKEFKNSTMEEWSLKCPACGDYHIPKFKESLNFDPTAADYQPITMTCSKCGVMSTEKEWKKGMGKWLVTNPEYQGTTRGFHLNELVSPWRTWQEIIEDFLTAKDDQLLLQTFVNTSLGEVWEARGKTVDDMVLLKNREHYGCEVPDDVLVLTAGVDTQDNRLEVEVVGWGLGQESWGIQYAVFVGDPAQDHVWKELEMFLDKKFKYSNGTEITISCVCIDSGGHNTDSVYKFVKPNEFKRWFAIKGKGGEGIPLTSKPSKNNKAGVNLFMVGVDGGKANVYSRLSIENPGPKYCHFPIEEEKKYDAEYFLSLTSEKMIIQDNGKIIWKKLRKNNEALDCRNYAMAAFDILSPQLERLYQLPRGDYYNTRKVVAKVKTRRILSKGVMV
ncbi:phage terminase large subunit family protein [Sebaldella termitidis]|uniref:phage terminase large subunit family protein n=1 Tax=Sebaldella termitidis TaxID=826 RepID=UPI003EC0EFA8